MTKKFFTRFTAAILTLIMLSVSFSLFACSSNNGSNLPSVNNNTTPNPTNKETSETTVGTSAESVDGTTSATDNVESLNTEGLQSDETTADVSEWVGENVSISKGEKTDYKIVVPKTMSKTLLDAVDSLKNAFSQKLGVTVENQKEDFYKLMNGGSMNGPKLAIGELSNDEMSQTLGNPLKDEEYIIKVVDGSLYIVGGTEEATAAAIEYFISTYMKGTVNSIELKEGIVQKKNASSSFKTLKISGNDIWKYKIIYHNDTTSKICADKISDAIKNATGYTLDMASDTSKATDYEILIGDTTRTESVDLIKTYANPSLYYDVKVVGKKLVCMGGGWSTLNKVTASFTKYMSDMKATGTNMTGSILTGNIKNEIDNSGMLTKASGTDVRIFNFNVLGVTYDYDTYKIFTSDEERGEYMADVALMYAPDIITTNELFKGHPEYNTFTAHLAKYYTPITTSEYDTGYPTASHTPDPSVGIPLQIFLKKSCNFKIVDSGWRYITDTKEEGSTEQNPWHGIHWAVLQNSAGKKFIVSVGHYGDGTTDNRFAKEHQAALSMAQASSGSKDTLPTIAAGDFFSKPTEACYKYHVTTCGFLDAQQSATTNCNGSKTQATCHPLGNTRTSGVIYDFILHNNKFSSLKFKVIKSTELEQASDHYPVCADLKFK